jgi:predicted amidohydrolase
MPRLVKVAAAQVGAVHSWTARSSTVKRLIGLLHNAHSQGAKLVVFPECAFTTFFPRYTMSDSSEINAWFEHGDDPTQSDNIKPLFDEAHQLGIDITVGYAERTSDGTGFNTCVYYSGKLGRVLSKYRKIHLPGTKDPFPEKDAVNQLEKRYFTPGDLGFQAFRAPDLVEGALKKGTRGSEQTTGKGDPIVGMMICNDRRWPEAWRVLGLQGVELVCCGFNTNGYAPQLWGSRTEITHEEAEKDALFHHALMMQSNSYMNACFSISAARAGMDDNKFDLIGGSSIVSPQGKIIAEAKTTGDEVVLAEIDLEDCRQGKEKVNWAARPLQDSANYCVDIRLCASQAN